MVLGSVFSPAMIKTNLESEDKDEVLEELVELYISAHPEASRSIIVSALKERENKQSTGIKPGFALPHAKTDQVKGVQGVVGISRSGVDFDSLDGKPVHIFFLFLSSSEGCSLHLRVLKRLSILLDDPEFYREILGSGDPESVYGIICKFEDTLATSM